MVECRIDRGCFDPATLGDVSELRVPTIIRLRKSTGWYAHGRMMESDVLCGHLLDNNVAVDLDEFDIISYVHTEFLFDTFRNLDPVGSHYFPYFESVHVFTIRLLIHKQHNRI